MGMARVSNLKARAALLVVGLLGTLLVLAMSACGGAGAGGQEEPKGEAKGSLPQEPAALSPGEYHSVKFKPPLSFKVSKPWSNTAKQRSDWIELGYERDTGFISFANAKKVFKPGTTNVVDAPKTWSGGCSSIPT